MALPEDFWNLVLFSDDTRISLVLDSNKCGVNTQDQVSLPTPVPLHLLEDVLYVG